MTPSYFVEDLKGDQIQGQFRVYFDLNDSQASYSPSSSSFSPGRGSLCSDQEEDKVKPCGEFCDHPPLMDEGSEDHDDNNLYQWMPSKMRILRKMMMSSNQSGGNYSSDSPRKFKDQEQSPSAVDQPTNTSRKANYKNTIDDTIRVCADCNTTKTPLWRSGPRGPKSLCNACGIRQRKARRAMAAAAAAAAAASSGTILPVATAPLKIKVKHKYKRSKSDLNDAPLKKRCKMAPNSPPKVTEKKTLIRFEDFTSRVLSKHYSAYEKVFPQDEKEAAILLMALSCGLVCS